MTTDEFIELFKNRRPSGDRASCAVNRAKAVQAVQETVQESRATRHVNHPEHDMQVACVQWFNYAYPAYRGLLFAVPNGAMLNGTAKQRMLAGKRLRDEGMVAGVADLLLLIPNKRYHGLAIEMKTATGTLSKEQREWGHLVELFGYKYIVIKPTKGRGGVELFIDEVKSYMKI